MRIVRFVFKEKERWGIVQGALVKVLDGSPYQSVRFTKEKISLEEIKLLVPATPSKIILAGLNYRDHARELKMKIPSEPVIFLKPNTSLIAQGEDIVYPRGVQRLDFEAELAVVMKKAAKDISAKNCHRYILGYTCLNDITARDIQKKDIQWTRSKSFDTFCPVGPWLQTDFDPAAVRIRALLNGTVKQDSSTRNFIFSVPQLIAFISRIMTLMPGDIISTGTPVGVGPMQPHDTIEVQIEGIGTLRNRVIKER